MGWTDINPLREALAADRSRTIPEDVHPRAETTPPDITEPRVAILMATYNGASYLAQQLESIAAQTYTNWTLWISDDGSTDSTRDILEKFKLVWPAGKIQLRTGPGKGYVANFLSLCCDPEIVADYFAYCDQDDIWLPEKLSRAIGFLRQIADNRPALYCSRTLLANETGDPIRLSPLFIKPPGLRNALVQSIAGANTMVFTESARRLMQMIGADADVNANDWLMYLAVTLFDGSVLYDLLPGILYRQHAHNAIGANTGWRARGERIRMFLRGDFKRFQERNLAVLARVESRMPEEQRNIFRRFGLARSAPLRQRLKQFADLGLYRQTRVDQIALWLGVFLKKI